MGLASEELVGHLDPRELQGRLVSRIAILEALRAVAPVAYAVEFYADLSLRVDTLGERRLPATHLLGRERRELSVDSGLVYRIDDVVDRLLALVAGVVYRRRATSWIFLRGRSCPERTLCRETLVTLCKEDYLLLSL